MFISPMMRSQSFTDPMPLNYELHKCFCFLSHPFDDPGPGWLESGGVGYFSSPW